MITAERHGSQYMAQFGIPGVSIAGYGKSAYAAKYDLLLRLLETSGSHMARVMQALGNDPGELQCSYEFTSDGVEITASNSIGQKRVIKWTKR